MSTIFGYPTTLTVLLDKISAKLLADGIVADSTAILPTLRDDDELFYNPPDDKFIMLYPMNFPTEMPAILPGAVQTEQYNGQLRVSLWDFIGEDWSPLQHQELKEALYTQITNWDALLKSLRQYMPFDDSGRGLLVDPMKNITGWRPAASRPDRKGRIKFVGVWSLKFVQDMT